jgi:hypothetical protein
MSPRVTRSRFRVLGTIATFPAIFGLPCKKREERRFDPPLPKELHGRLLQMLGEKRSGLFPGIFRRCIAIAWSLVTEKSVGRFGIDFHREVLLFIFELGFETFLELGSFPLSDFFLPVHCFEVRKRVISYEPGKTPRFDHRPCASFVPAASHSKSRFSADTPANNGPQR